MTDKNVCENWHFVYQDITYPDLPHGYYSNKKTKETYGFKEGIKSIVKIMRCVFIICGILTNKKSRYVFSIGFGQWKRIFDSLLIIEFTY